MTVLFISGPSRGFGSMNHMAPDLVGSDRTRRYLELVYDALDA